MKKLPKKLNNGYYEFTCASPEKFKFGARKVNRYILFNEVLTAKIGVYVVSSLEDFYKEYGVTDYKFIYISKNQGKQII